MSFQSLLDVSSLYLGRYRFPTTQEQADFFWNNHFIRVAEGRPLPEELSVHSKLKNKTFIAPSALEQARLLPDGVENLGVMRSRSDFILRELFLDAIVKTADLLNHEYPEDIRSYLYRRMIKCLKKVFLKLVDAPPKESKYRLGKDCDRIIRRTYKILIGPTKTKDVLGEEDFARRKLVF